MGEKKMAPTYVKSIEIVYNNNDELLNKNVIEYEVYWDIDRVMLVLLYFIGLLLLLWAITFSIIIVLSWKAWRLISTKGKAFFLRLTKTKRGEDDFEDEEILNASIKPNVE